MEPSNVNAEEVFSYGSALSVIRMSKVDISSYLTRGLISTNYQGRPARNTSSSSVCFTVMPDAVSATERVSKMIRMNFYLKNMLKPEDMFKQYQEAGVVLSAVIADFELIAQCRNVTYVGANGRLLPEHFPRYVSGIDAASFTSCQRGHSNMFDAEVRVYLDEEKVTLSDPSLTGVTQDAWKGLMVVQSDIPQVREWFRGIDRDLVPVRDLPIFDEKQKYVCSTVDLF